MRLTVLNFVILMVFTSVGNRQAQQCRARASSVYLVPGGGRPFARFFGDLSVRNVTTGTLRSWFPASPRESLPLRGGGWGCGCAFLELLAPLHSVSGAAEIDEPFTTGL